MSLTRGDLLRGLGSLAATAAFTRLQLANRHLRAHGCGDRYAEVVGGPGERPRRPLLDAHRAIGPLPFIAPRPLRLLVLVLTALHLPIVAGAQGLAPGIWSGLVSDPFGNTKAVTYAVIRNGDSLTVTMTEEPAGTPVALADLRETGDTLHFSWTGTGGASRVSCTLVRQPDRAYDGPCVDPRGRQGRMRMVPPRNR